jgi:hypothetical protein
MFGIRYLKVPPTTYVLHYVNGKVRQEGPGRSFFYFGPTSEIVLVPVESTDVPFVFQETTADFQDVTIQGELTFRVVDARKLAETFNFSVDHRGRYRSEDRSKLGDRLIYAAQILARAFVQQQQLRSLLLQSDELSATVSNGLKQSSIVEMLGVEVLTFTVISLKPAPEMGKALQAEARENLLKQADEAIYVRRNAVVEMERGIREAELETEIKVAQKQQQVQEAEMTARIANERDRATLLEKQAANDRLEADVRAYALQAVLEPLKSVDWKVLMAASGNQEPGSQIALGFRELAENAAKIGELNISPELLQALVKKSNPRN